MGVSFKISKKGSRYKPKSAISELTQFNENPDISLDSSKNHTNGNDEDAAGLTGSSMSSGRDHNFGEDEVSFILNLYPNGYSIVKASENDNGNLAAFQDGMKHPYDRASEGLFAAIESGRLPGSILDDVPCKFVDGAVMCEVRDYRKCISQPGSESATISKICLKMSLENVVKDIPLMADDSWTYGDLMEVESRILNALQPKLCLDPVPRLDRLSRNPASSKINLGLAGIRKRRLRQIPEVTVTSNNRPHGKKICIDRAPDTSSYGPANQRTMQSPLQSLVLPPGAADVLQHPQAGSFVDKFQGTDLQWRNPMVQQSNSSAAQYGNAGLHGLKQEKTEANMVKPDLQMMEPSGDHMDPRGQHRFQHPMTRPNFQQVGWNNHSPQIEKEPIKGDLFPKRKPNQSPRFSVGAMAQSPLSVRSGEMSGGSMGPHYGVVSSGGPLGQVQRDKSGVNSVPAVGRASSGSSFANDMSHQQTQVVAKRRSNSLPKAPAISGVGSPASVNNMGAPMNAPSPSISTPQITEQDMLERFAKIEMVTMRHQLNRKKNKVDEYPRKPRGFSAQELLVRLASVANNEYADDSREMSKSLVGGHMNVCKIRVVHVRPGQGNMLPMPVRTRMIFSEKPTDGTVAMHYGDLDDGDYLNIEEHLPTLPNTHWADLLADQFCALVIREGYNVEEVVQPRPPRLTAPPNSQPNNSNVDIQQHSDSFPGQGIESKPTISNTSLNSNSNALQNSGMHPPGHVSGVAMPRPQQMDPPQPNQSSLMQQVPPQFQRSSLMLPNNPTPQLNAYGQNSNLPLGNQIDNKSSIQMLQQPPQQSQPADMQRKMMMGLGTPMGVGQIGNMGLGGLSNVVGMGGAKGIGPIAGMGRNMGQNAMGLSQANAISQHLRAGPQAMAAQRLRLMQQGMLGGSQSGIAGMPGASRQMQPGSTGLSMLGQTLNRGNMGQIQRTAMGQMGMPNLMPGMNVPFNHQQLQQFQQLRQHQQQQQQQQQLQQQQHPQPRQYVMPQQEATSPLQSVLTSQQAGSPSTMGVPQQMNQLTIQQQASPQQMGQRTPMSPPLSSGPVHPMSAGNPDVCPASPALSSQTLGSVGSITNSPMDLPGVNKGSSVTNT